MAPRGRTWADQIISSSLASGGSFVTDLLEHAPTSDTLTVARIIGLIGFDYTETDENQGTQVVYVGIGVSSVEAFTAGVLSLPDPRSDTEYPPRGWLFVEQRIVAQTLPGATAGASVWRQRAQFQFDLGGMRKVDKGRLFMVTRNEVFSGTGAALVSVGRTRGLCLT